MPAYFGAGGKNISPPVLAKLVVKIALPQNDFFSSVGLGVITRENQKPKLPYDQNELSETGKIDHQFGLSSSLTKTILVSSVICLDNQNNKFLPNVN